jgi:hypothetical protein
MGALCQQGKSNAKASRRARRLPARASMSYASRMRAAAEPVGAQRFQRADGW